MLRMCRRLKHLFLGTGGPSDRSNALWSDSLQLGSIVLKAESVSVAASRMLDNSVMPKTPANIPDSSHFLYPIEHTRPLSPGACLTSIVRKPIDQHRMEKRQDPCGIEPLNGPNDAHCFISQIADM